MLHDPLVGEELWPHTTFQSLKGRLLIDSPIRWDALVCIIPLKSKKQSAFFRFDNCALLGAGLLSLYVSFACSAALSQGHTETPVFLTQNRS
jgi:hypothetical protein